MASHPGSLDHMAAQLARIEGNLERLPDSVRQNLANDLWSRIPALVNDAAAQTFAGAGPFILTIPPSFSGAVIYTAVVVAVPSGATGLLTLDGDSMPLPGGTVTSLAVRKLLTSQAMRSLTISGPGTAAVWLMGEQAPTYGVLR